MWASSETRQPFPDLRLRLPCSNHPVSEEQLAVKNKWQELLNSILLWAHPVVILKWLLHYRWDNSLPGTEVQARAATLIAPCTQHLQLSQGHLSDRSAKAVQVYELDVSGIHATSWWRATLGKAEMSPQLEQPLILWSWVMMQLTGWGGEEDAALLALHGVSIPSLGGLELEIQTESGRREIQCCVSAASESHFVWQPLPHECRLHHDCSTLPWQAPRGPSRLGVQSCWRYHDA